MTKIFNLKSALCAVTLVLSSVCCNSFEDPNAADTSVDAQADQGTDVSSVDAGNTGTDAATTDAQPDVQEVSSTDTAKAECAQDMDCNDNNVCTTDICGNGAKCVHVASSGTCTDNNACTDNDTCDAGACKGTAKVCEDNNLCTDDFCVNGMCAHGINTVGCDDGNACTSSDKCDATKCVGVVIECDDKNPCTTDTCDKTKGCAFTPVVCEDNDACTTDTCDNKTGSCQFVQKVCDDGKAWTYDWCSNTDYYGQAGQCVSEEKWNGCAKDSDCEDGDKCTINICDSLSGTCKKVYENCDDDDYCTTDTCVPAKGCVNSQFDCTDYASCTNDWCFEGSCYSIQKNCNDNNPNTADSCNANTGACVNTPLTQQPTQPTADIMVSIGCSDAACEPFLYFGIAKGEHKTTSGANSTIEIVGSKAEFCMWGAQVATRVALSLNSVQPWYGCDATAPASKSGMNIAINGVPVPKPFAYISKPNICLGNGEGNIVLPKSLFGCP